MFLSYKYKLYPTQDQEVQLKCTLASLCDLYNELRSEKVNKYKENGKNLNRTDLRRLTLEKRRSNNKLQAIHSQVVQNTADRLSSAFKNFFEGRAKFPKNKKYKNYKSFTYPQSGFNVTPTKNNGHKLYLSRIGEMRVFIHRPMTGRVNRLCIKRDYGEWYAIFLIENNNTISSNEQEFDIGSMPEERITGGDLGLEKFITLDNGRFEDNPRFLRQSETKLKRLQIHMSHKKKGSRRRRRLGFRLARLHQHIKRQRENYQNQIIATILLNKDTDVLILEKLAIENMMKNHNLAKSLQDASLARFATKAFTKARILHKHVLLVDPWGTTQFCYNCLHWVLKVLSEREHNCPNCGVKLPRDENSSKLIKWLGIHGSKKRSPPSDGGLSLAERKPLPSLRGMVSLSAEAGSL
jgi:putative transposase